MHSSVVGCNARFTERCMPREDRNEPFTTYVTYYFFRQKLAALAQTVACLPLVQRVRGSIPGGVVNFHVKIFNLGARRGGDVHFLIARLYVTVLD